MNTDTERKRWLERITPATIVAGAFVRDEDRLLQIIEEFNTQVVACIKSKVEKGWFPSYAFRYQADVIAVHSNRQVPIEESYTCWQTTSTAEVYLGLSMKTVRSRLVQWVIVHELVHCYIGPNRRAFHHASHKNADHDDLPWEVEADAIASSIVNYTREEWKETFTEEEVLI